MLSEPTTGRAAWLNGQALVRLPFVTGLIAGSSRRGGTGVLIATRARRATKSIKAFLTKDCGENPSVHSDLDHLLIRSASPKGGERRKFSFECVRFLNRPSSRRGGNNLDAPATASSLSDAADPRSVIWKQAIGAKTLRRVLCR